jgi:hypothetical protein
VVFAVFLAAFSRSYILAYNSHALKEIFNVHTLDLQVRLTGVLISGRAAPICISAFWLQSFFACGWTVHALVVNSTLLFAWRCGDVCCLLRPKPAGQRTAGWSAPAWGGQAQGCNVLRQSYVRLVRLATGTRLPLLRCALPQAVAKSFGFSGPPKVSLNIESKAAHGRRAKKVQGQAAGGGADYRRFKPASGHAFSAANPYGVRAKGDNRQLARF